MSLNRLHITLCATLLTAALVAARPTRAHAETPSTDVVNYTFDEEQVTAGLVSPLGEILQVRTRKPRQSLIRVREQFVAELYKSVEGL